MCKAAEGAKNQQAVTSVVINGKGKALKLTMLGWNSVHVVHLYAEGWEEDILLVILSTCMCLKFK